MNKPLESLKSEFSALVQNGESIREDLASRYEPGSLSPESSLIVDLEERYQAWFSESSALIKEVLSSRYPEFQSLYETSGIRGVISRISYGAPVGVDALFELDIEGIGVNQRAIKAYFTQLNILKSASAGFESRLLNIRQLLHADLMGTELESARELASNGFGRAAGSVAGVVLESHLAEYCKKRNFKLRKKRPTIGDWIELLQNENAVDAAMHLRLKALNEIRVLCSHHKSRDPTTEDVADLIAGVEKVTGQLL